MTTPTPADIELPAHTCRLSGIESDLLRKYAEAFARAAVIADRASTAASCAVPAGWKIVRNVGGELVINGPPGGVVVSADAMAPRVIPEEILHALASALLDAPATARAERTDAATAEPSLPESLIRAVDAWFVQNTGLGGCSDKDVAELAAIFYGVTHEGGRESLEDALAVVESFGPGIQGLNDTFARQIILAEEVRRLQSSIPEGCTPADARVLREANHALAVEVHQLREDAENYRWLRSQNWNDSALCVVVNPKAAVRLGHYCPSGTRLDDAIRIARGVPAPTAGDAGGAA